jgi:serine/threonine protein kinase
MLSHRLPFGGDKAQDVIASILKDEPPPLSLEVPDRLRWIVEKALRRNREDRYQTAREMFFDLREIAEATRAYRRNTHHPDQRGYQTHKFKRSIPPQRT